MTFISLHDFLSHFHDIFKFNLSVHNEDFGKEGARAIDDSGSQYLRGLAVSPRKIVENVRNLVVQLHFLHTNHSVSKFQFYVIKCSTV